MLELLLIEDEPGDAFLFEELLAEEIDGRADHPAPARSARRRS